MTIVLNGSSGITNDGGYTGDGVVFADTTPANTLVTTTGGNVGIGTSSPVSDAKLTVSSLTTESYVFFQRTNPTVFDAAIGNNGGSIVFKGGADSSTVAGLTEFARIDSSGNLLVGTTAQPSGSVYGSGFIASSESRRVLMMGGSATIESNRVEFYNPNGQVGRIATNGSATSYVTSSDYRLKENIAPMTGALSVVQQLKPCTYKWKVDGSDGQGFIAHELQAVVPDCVTGEKDAVEVYTDEEGNEQTRPVYQGIDTSFLVATLTAAIQEQQAMIVEMKAELDALKAKVGA